MPVQLNDRPGSERVARIHAAQVRKVQFIIGGSLGLVVILAVSGVVYAIHKAAKAPLPVTTTPTPTISVGTPSPLVSSVPSPSPSPSPTPTPTPTLSPGMSPSATLPISVQSFLSTFYADYKAKNAGALSVLFTSDGSSSDTFSHAHLFKGTDPDGTNPGGPTLFSTDSASQTVAGYTVQQQVQTGDNWQLTISEERVSGSGDSVGNQTTTMILVPSNSTWLISLYYHQGAAASKYDGFLNP